MNDLILVFAKLLIGFLSAITIINFTGKGNLAPNSASDQVQNYVLGGIIGGVIYNKNIGILEYLLVMLVWFILVIGFKWIKKHNIKLKQLIDGKALIIINNGKVNVENCKKAGLSAHDVAFKLRANNVYSVKEAKRAVVEQNGQFIIVLEGEENPKFPIITDGHLQKDILEIIGKDEEWLKERLNEKGYEEFTIPDDVGGRFSVLTAVGLLPIAVAGINIDDLMNGAKTAREDYSKDFTDNDCYKYVAIRNILYKKNYNIEILANYEPRFHYISEWWKQLYGESEGKDKKGIFPASVDLTTDLHSMGQYIQDGRRNLFETILNVENSDKDIVIKKEVEDLDGLNYLEGKGLSFVNNKAFEGTLLAHIDGGVPNLVINIPEVTAFNIGYLIYFFEKACAISGYLLEVNPFDQPGVESYKKNMFALLGKKGYEELSKELNKRLKK